MKIKWNLIRGCISCSKKKHTSLLVFYIKGNSQLENVSKVLASSTNLKTIKYKCVVKLKNMSTCCKVMFHYSWISKTTCFMSLPWN